MRIGVFCSARDVMPAKYRTEARRLGRLMAQRGHDLAFGGGGCGLMGDVSQAVFNNGGHVYGVSIPHLVEQEPTTDKCTHLEIVETMSARKDLIIAASDSFIILPGGVGTMEEFFQVLCHNQIKLYKKPIAIVNQSGYYTPLLDFFDNAVRERFMGKSIMDMFTVVDTASEAIDAVEEAFTTHV